MTNTPRIVTIIQARLGSSRLPGKVLLDIAGRPMLARVTARAMQARRVCHTVIATSTRDEDTPVAEAARGLGVEVFRGAETDVLDRYYQAALAFGADAVVRITADCPLIDASFIDACVDTWLQERCDYVSNAVEPPYLRGLDVEVLSMAALASAWREAKESYHRAHVTAYIYQHPEQFRCVFVPWDADYSAHRWTVDTEEDLALVRAVYARLADTNHFSWRDVLRVLGDEPSLMELNSSVHQKDITEG